MTRVYSAPYFDTTFSGRTGVAADGTNFTPEKINTFDSRHLMYILVQLRFNFTLDTTSLVSRDSSVSGAGDIYPKTKFNVVTQTFFPSFSQFEFPVFICDSRDAVIEMLLSHYYSLFFICLIVLCVYFKVYEGEFP